MKRAVFLDRDGVINNRIEHGYVTTWEEFVFLPDTCEAIKLLNELGISVIVITNQSAINRGLMTEEQLNEIHESMQAALQENGAQVDAIFYCPHRPEEGCDCRKPKPGLLIAAAQANDIDLKGSWLVGDSQSDIEAGMAVRCRTYLFRPDDNLLSVIKLIAREITKQS